jgi:putative hemolysin
MGQGDVTRDISYAPSARSRGGRALIRVLENATGRLSLIRRAAGYEDEVARGRSFWQVIPERFGLTLDILGGDLGQIPANGPLILIANHPYGILDGLMMGHLLDAVRGDFRILANSVFRAAPALDRVILPIWFDATRAAMALNLDTRARALRYLAGGGAIGVFPGGTVSTAARPFAQPMDPGWRNFTARMIARSDATVVPIFFDGHNSRLFQIASHLHSTLRLGLLIKEFKARVDEPVRVVVGAPIAAHRLADLKSDPGALMDALRRETYALSPRPIPSYDYGYEFEDRYRARARD